jgi:hypothetical protein
MRLVQVYYFRARQRQGSEHITHSTSHHITQSKSGSELQAYVQVMGLVMQPLGRVVAGSAGTNVRELGRGRVLGGGTGFNKIANANAKRETQNSSYLAFVCLACLSVLMGAGA